MLRSLIVVIVTIVLGFIISVAFKINGYRVVMVISAIVFVSSWVWLARVRRRK